MSDSESKAQELSVPLRDDVEALRRMVEGTARVTGESFFPTLVKHLAAAVGARYALACEFLGEGRVRSLGYWAVDHLLENYEWDVSETPCEAVLRGGLCFIPEGVERRYPKEKGIQSYLGVPLQNEAGQVLGHLAVADERPMEDEPRRLPIFRIFAARAVAELERMHAERRLRESEANFRNLFQEAPIPYVYERLDSTWVSANSAAQKLLGVRPEEAAGLLGFSVVADAPGVQERIRAAFDAVSQGREQSAVEIELRRRDNGEPVWVQWWSKPDGDGKHTRTMLVDVTDRVLMEREKARLEQENVYLQEEIKSVHNFEEIVGRSPKLLMVLQGVQQVAKTTASVLVTGETGTGKELIARAIHSASERREKMLVKVNCAALPTGLVESELFGHERGAFSGAIARRIGRFELADGGTIFLDEVGEIPLEVQVKLLRVLQEREFDRVGGSKSIRTDVRVIAATNRDLKQMVAQGTFRQDLYYRLNVFPIHLPPLRDRVDDLPLLVSFLLSKFRARLGKNVVGVSASTMQLLQDYDWPGNIRELENVLERAVILASGPIVQLDPQLLARTAEPRPRTLQPPAPSAPAEPQGTLAEAQRRIILNALTQTEWVIDGPKGAAALLGLHPNTLRSRMKKIGIARPAGHEGS